MEYDIAGESPLYGAIEVKGILRFSNNLAINLNCKRIFINGGKFGIGTKSRPYLQKGGVTLHGPKEDPMQLALEDVGITAGSKIIANLGELKLYGKVRTFKMTRLLVSAKKGDTTITVEKALDLVKGDKIGLVATSYIHNANDVNDVESYDAATGIITLKTALNFYHFGAAESTAAGYSGIDMRGEVLSLSRNLKIQGGAETSWGCQILSADIL